MCVYLPYNYIHKQNRKGRRGTWGDLCQCQAVGFKTSYSRAYIDKQCWNISLQGWCLYLITFSFSQSMVDRLKYHYFFLLFVMLADYYSLNSSYTPAFPLTSLCSQISCFFWFVYFPPVILPTCAPNAPTRVLLLLSRLHEWDVLTFLIAGTLWGEEDSCTVIREVGRTHTHYFS